MEPETRSGVVGRRPERALVAAGGLVTQPRPAPDGATHVSMACCVCCGTSGIASLRETRLFIVGSTSRGGELGGAVCFVPKEGIFFSFIFCIFLSRPGDISGNFFAH